MSDKTFNVFGMSPQQPFNFRNYQIPSPNPNNFWGLTPNQRKVVKIAIEGDNGIAFFFGELPYFLIRRVFQSEFSNLFNIRKNVFNLRHQSERNILVKQKFHEAMPS